MGHESCDRLQQPKGLLPVYAITALAVAISAVWLAAEGHWYPTLRFHLYALRHRPALYLNWKAPVHVILQSTPWLGKVYYRHRLGWSKS